MERGGGGSEGEKARRRGWSERGRREEGEREGGNREIWSYVGEREGKVNKRETKGRRESKGIEIQS